MAARQLSATGTELAALQEALCAEGVGGGRRRLLLVLQGMDTSGKGGVISHVVGQVNPQGVRIASFTKPTPLSGATTRVPAARLRRRRRARSPAGRRSAGLTRPPSTRCNQVGRVRGLDRVSSVVR